MIGSHTDGDYLCLLAQRLAVRHDAARRLPDARATKGNKKKEEEEKPRVRIDRLWVRVPVTLVPLPCTEWVSAGLVPPYIEWVLVRVPVYFRPSLSGCGSECRFSSALH